MELDERPDTNDAIETGTHFYDKVGPGTPAGEYLRRFWMPVALLDDVKPGRAKTVKILSELFTFYRGESGAPHLVANECAHRHTRLAPHGRVEEECIRCFYHGWMYDATGQCLEQPAEGRESFAHKVRITSYPVRDYHGIVFAYFGAGEPPEFQHLDLFDGPGVREVGSYVRQTNFFNSLDNQADWVHANFVHYRSEFTKIGINRAIPVVSAEETEYGLKGYLTYDDGVVGVNFVLMPIGMYIIGSGSRIDDVDGLVYIHQMAWRTPIDDHSHRSFNIYYADVTGAAAERFSAARAHARQASTDMPGRAEIMKKIYSGELHVDEVDESRPDIVGIQDTVTMEMQRPISEREPDRLGRSDAAVIVLRKMYMREVRKMLNGEPIKPWKWPSELKAEPQFVEAP